MEESEMKAETRVEIVLAAAAGREGGGAIASLPDQRADDLVLARYVPGGRYGGSEREIGGCLHAAQTREIRILPSVVSFARHKESLLNETSIGKSARETDLGYGKQEAEGFMVSLSRDVETGLEGCS